MVVLLLLFMIFWVYVRCCHAPTVGDLCQISAGGLHKGILKWVYTVRNMVKWQNWSYQSLHKISGLNHSGMFSRWNRCLVWPLPRPGRVVVAVYYYYYYYYTGFSYIIDRWHNGMQQMVSFMGLLKLKILQYYKIHSWFRRSSQSCVQHFYV
jgi:hypothetical protein